MKRKIMLSITLVLLILVPYVRADDAEPETTTEPTPAPTATPSPRETVLGNIAGRSEDVLNIITEAGEDAAFACYPVGAAADGVYLNEDDLFPLASAFKIVVLAEYAVQVAAGELDAFERVPVAELDRYYLPGTDGGAHPAWLQSANVDENQTVSLDDVAFGMIRYSSNANTDYLLERLGMDGFPALYEALGVQDSDLPAPILGNFLVFSNQEVGYVDPDDLTPEIYAEEVERLADLYLNDEDWREAQQAFRAGPIPPEVTQYAYFNTYGTQGSARDYAAIMEAIYTGDALGEEASAIIRQTLEWPMDIPGNDALFVELGTKGGTLPGILTSAYYGTPLDGAPDDEGVVVAIFYRALNPMTFFTWSRDFTQQTLEIRVILEGCDVLESALETADN